MASIEVQVVNNMGKAVKVVFLRDIDFSYQ